MQEERRRCNVHNLDIVGNLCLTACSPSSSLTSQLERNQNPAPWPLTLPHRLHPLRAILALLLRPHIRPTALSLLRHLLHHHHHFYLWSCRPLTRLTPLLHPFFPPLVYLLTCQARHLTGRKLGKVATKVKGPHSLQILECPCWMLFETQVI